MEKVETYVDKSFVLRAFQTVFSYFSPLTLIAAALIAIWIHNYNSKRSRMVKLINKIPGPPALPFIGESTASARACGSLKLKYFIAGNAIEINVEHDGKAIFIFGLV